MATYATVAQFKAAGLPPLALQNTTDAAIQTALDLAGGMADSYIGARLTLPLASFGPELTRCVVNLAAFDVLNTRGWQPNAEGPDTMLTRYKWAIDWLRDVAAGRATPGAPANTNVNGYDGRVDNDTFVIQGAGVLQGGTDDVDAYDHFFDLGGSYFTGSVRRRGW